MFSIIRPFDVSDEVDLPVIYTNPSKNVIEVLQENRTVHELINNLPVEI